MIKEIFYSLITFVLSFLFHIIYSIWKFSHISKQWIQVENISFLSSYLSQQNYFLSYSYALAGAFTIYALLTFLKNRRSGVTGVVSGVTLTGFLYAGVCFLSGCCGSPMLAVYLGLFGSSFIGFTKPLIAIITTISVAIGYFWIKKKSKKCCEDGEKCSSS